MNNPRISAIIIYKDKNNLEECLKSITEQSFSNIEIICINNAAKDNAEQVVKNFAEKDERIKLINLPFENDENFAKKAGIGVAEGEFICFIKPNKEISKDYLKDIYLNTALKSDIEIEDNHLYRRNFLENDEEITKIIEDKVQKILEKQSESIKEEKESITKDFNNFYETTAENIKNSTYDITCRFGQLEKNFYDKDYEFQQTLQKSLKEHGENFDEKIHNVYEDISKVYDYINSEINQKGAEIGKVYEEITKNYHYTEQLIEDRKNEFAEVTNNKRDIISAKLKELEKDIVVRYVNLKRIMDTQLDEIKLNISAISGEPVDNTANYVNKAVSENIDKVYSHINNTSSSLYNDITKMYKELNERIITDKAENKYLTEMKISELRNEINSKLDAINNQTDK